MGTSWTEKLTRRSRLRIECSTALLNFSFVLVFVTLVGCARDPAASSRPDFVPVAMAPIPCVDRGPVAGHDLVEPRVIAVVDNQIDTKLVIRKVKHECVPLRISGEWQWTEMVLRTYGSPENGNNPSDPELIYSIPGPTFRVRKATLADASRPSGDDNPVIEPGSSLNLLLRNELPNNTFPYNQCKPILYQACRGSSTQCNFDNKDGSYTCPSDASIPCVETEVPQDFPECFHGADVTNLHYHGTHVSPQPHQDYVLLKLFSDFQTEPPPPCGPQTGAPCPENGPVAVGEYQTNINPLPWNQPPGTHWYHPHNHGSTALQVLNGLAGALLIDGPFDEWLNEYYGIDSEDAHDRFEQLLIVGQNWPDIVFFSDPLPAGYPPQPLVNGQAEPKLRMRYGETQRWRFVGATVQSSAQVALTFPEELDVVQIAQDGVQFSPDNYDYQPLAIPVKVDSNCQGDCETVDNYLLAPGNRLDFLVKAPAATTPDQPPATYVVETRVVGQLAEAVEEHLDSEAAALLADLRARVGDPVIAGTRLGAELATPLLTIVVEGTDPDPRPPPTKAQWPAMPYYLRDIDPDTHATKTLAFSMTDPDNPNRPKTPGQALNGFWINGQQYDPECANSEQTMTLGTTETWHLTNDSTPNHPFHMHINPFQVIAIQGRYGRLQGGSATLDKTYPFPVWQDTIAIPTPSASGANGQVTILQRFEDYSGAFVLHCHFLGHEDRGMMFNVQTICADNGKFGTTQANGGADDCSVAASLDPNPLPSPPNPVCRSY